MAESSYFFNSFEGDRRYTAAEFVEYFASFIGNGVFWGGNYLKVDAASSMDVKVQTGKGFINGYYYINKDAAKTMTVEPSHLTMPRIDKVVLRLDLSQSVRRIHAVIKKGTPSDTPSAPGLQRDNARWELGLADIRVNAGATVISQSNITDLRLNATYCGVVAALINQPDLTSIFNQYQAKYNEINTQWDAWFAQGKTDWNDLKKLYNGWFNQIKAELFATKSTDFDDWSRAAGYTRKTEFLANGNINETLYNTLNSSVLATRATVFQGDGSISETLKFNEPPLTVSRTTGFSGNLVNEVVT